MAQPLQLKGVQAQPYRDTWRYYLRSNRLLLGTSDDHAAVLAAHRAISAQAPDAISKKRAPGGGSTFNDLCDAFEAVTCGGRNKKKPKTIIAYRGHNKALRALWGQLPPAAITKRAIETYINGLADAGTVWTAHLRCHHLRGLFNFALRDTDNRQWGLREQGNLALLVKPPSPGKRTALFEDADERKVMAWARQHDRMMLAAYVLSVFTAQRLCDVLKMTTADFIQSTEFYGGRRVTVHWVNCVQEKTGKRVWVPMHPELIAFMRDEHVIRAAGPGPHLILANMFNAPFTNNSFNFRWVTMLRACGLNWKVERARRHTGEGGLQHRDLRRTAMVRLSRAGATMQEVAAISGHSLSTTAKIIERYIPTDRHMALAGMHKLALWSADRRKAEAD
jgi:hypothetical protein